MTTERSTHDELFLPVDLKTMPSYMWFRFLVAIVLFTAMGIPQGLPLVTGFLIAATNISHRMKGQTMNNNSRWAAGVLITLAVIIGVGSYAIYKHHQNMQDVGHLAPPTNPQNPSHTSTNQTPTPSCYTAAQAASEEGQTGCVQFTGYSYTSYSGQMYLDQYTSAPYGFSVWIPAGTSGGSSLLSQYNGQAIDVIGTITSYNGEPEIEVTSASQIKVAQ